MKKNILIINLLVWVLAPGLFAQKINPADDPNGIVCKVEGNRLVFDIDLRQTLANLYTQASRFDIDTAVLRQALSGVPAIVTADGLWTSIRPSDGKLILSKDLGDDSSKEPSIQADVIMIDDAWIRSLLGFEPVSMTQWGVNQLNDPVAFTYSDGLAAFSFKGGRNTKKVFLSGTFNNWSTMLTPMQKNEKGWWCVTLPLKPGEYEYKYIVDGAWTTDPLNELKRPNNAGSENSVVYAYNHTFKLKGFTKARRVTLAASFNGWNPRSPRMNKTDEGWELDLWVREGTHAYKYVVDGEWMADPGAKVNRPDGAGNANSFMSIGDTLFFKLWGFPGARRVMVAGNFNVWNREELAMTKISGGWQLPYVLGPGMYEYKFIVDGNWITDPDNPFTTGNGDATNSILTVKPNYVFRLHGYEDAREVMVSGSFNGWSKSGYRMVRKGDNWIFPIYLSRGKHSYKFVVDGKWILDPDNKLWENNQYDTGNSILWIE
ncbi:MAG: glycogen-binding domain-containing protein [Bacteroidales bacterium]|nr:glycogen-binding domain-containing protein [Bacteroidales bacterium]MDD3664533.1 glycogen-binding domain-containing protein [Bacteroidales bacterium]